jgi:GntR family transcriptional regulator
MLRKSTMPLYHQLRELLGEKIESGEWESGHRLPGEYDLAVEFQVSRATVRQAMQLLENQGLVERIQGRGTFVGRPKVANDLLSLWVFAPPRETEIKRLRLEAVPVSSTVASKLEIPGNAEVYELERIILMEGEPLMLITSWLPKELFPNFEERYTEKFGIARTISAYHNISGFHQHKEVEVTILDATEAGLLQVNPGAPGMLLTYLNRFADDRPFEYRKIIVRGDRCKYYADLDLPEPLL